MTFDAWDPAWDHFWSDSEAGSGGSLSVSAKSTPQQIGSSGVQNTAPWSEGERLNWLATVSPHYAR